MKSALTILVLSMAALSACAHRADSSLSGRGDMPVASRPASETRSTMDTTNAPMLHSDEIADRMLRLIDSIRDRDGLSPDNIQRITGIPVAFDPEDSDRYGFHGRVDNTWLYDLGSVVDQAAGGVRGLQFFFAAPGNPEADSAPVCSPGLDTYMRRLGDMGFTASPVRGDLNQLRYWEFIRGVVRVRATVNTTADGARSCVRLITIDV